MESSTLSSSSPATTDRGTGTSREDSQKGKAVNWAGRKILFWSLAASGLAADLLTKHWVFSAPRLQHGAIYWLWEGHAGFQQSLNEGALFGMGQGQVKWFALFSLFALIGIPLWLFRYGAARDRWLLITLGCIVGGILGNLYDRLGWHGLQWEQFVPNRSGPVYAVRDWVLWCWDYEKGQIWPNFNIADSLLVCGAISLFLHAYFGDHAKGNETDNENPNHSEQERR